MRGRVTETNCPRTAGRDAEDAHLCTLGLENLLSLGNVTLWCLSCEKQEWIMLVKLCEVSSFWCREKFRTE